MSTPQTKRAPVRSGRTQRARAARLDFRVDAETKRLVARAARLEKQSVADFCSAALTEVAQHAIQRHQSVVLSDAEREAFFDVLVHPPKPNARLRAALRRERARIEP